MTQPASPIGVFVTPVTPLQQNCTTVWCTATNKAAVIDPGGSVDAVLAEVTRRGLTLDQIWITHGHLDHAGGAAEMQEKTGVQITGPQKADQFWIDRIVETGRMYGLPEARPFTPDRWLEDGDTVQVGHETLTVRHCPGHTPGHVVFHSASAQRVFVGDVLFAGSIGRTDFPGGNHQQLLDAIRTRLWPMGDDTVFIPGHGPEGTLGRERRTNPYVVERA